MTALFFDQGAFMIREKQIVGVGRLAAEQFVADGTATAGHRTVTATAEHGICEESGYKDLLATGKVTS